MGNLSIVIPESGTNLIKNPSFEVNVTDDWTYTGAGGSAAQSSTRARYGAYSAKIEGATGGTATFASGSVTVSDGDDIAVSCLIYPDTSGGSITVEVGAYDTGSASYRTSDDNDTGDIVDDQWNEVLLTWNNDTGGDRTIQFLLTVTATTGKYAYLDGVQMESKAYNTTYMDGDQDGCAWNATAHNSTTERSASGPGGRARQFEDLNWPISRFQGFGVMPVSVRNTPHALRPGALYDGQHFNERQLLLTGTLENVGGTLSQMHSRRQTLVRAMVSPVAAINERETERTLRYTGAATDKEIGAAYDAGLELNDTAGFTEKDMTVRMIAHDPLFYDRFDSALILDTNDGETVRLVAGRVDGAWSVLGPPDSSGTYTDVRAVLAARDGVYFGGDFTNFDNDAAQDGITFYDPSDGSWNAVGSGVGAGVVYDIIEAPDGDIYAVGSFTNMGGVAAADYVARWDGSSWNAVGTPNTGTASITAVYAATIGTDGTLYVTGDFSNFADVAAADMIAAWDGSSWSALSTGLGNTGYALAVHPDGTLYVGGVFSSPNQHITQWDGSSFSAVGSSNFDGDIYALAMLDDGSLVAGGDFEAYGTDERLHVARWNGVTWLDMAGGLGAASSTDAVWSLVTGPDGLLYGSGDFVGFAADDAELNSAAAWNGSAWLPLDFVAPSSGIIYDFGFYGDDLYIGFDQTGSATYAGTATASYDGTAQAYPVIVIKRSGGTSATLRSIINEETEAAIYAEYALLDGETLTIDLRPGAVSITSNVRGNAYGDIHPASDLAQWYLVPGADGSRNNVISAYVEEAGSPTITAYMYWRDAYVSAD